MFLPFQLKTINYKLKTNSQQGVVVIFAVLLIGIILSIVLTLSLIFASRIRSASDTKSSVAAAFAAETAIEWCLYVNRINPAAAMPVLSNNATFINGNTNAAFVHPPDCSVLPIKAVGTYRGVNRSFEINF